MILALPCLLQAHAACIRYLTETTTRCECACHD